MQILVQYSEDGFNTYALAHAAGGDGTTGLAASPGGRCTPLSGTVTTTSVI